MPNPTAGPSRRSHTKSRKGCQTCKKRHIRCDETFPQCKKCTKYNVECDYKRTVPAEAMTRSPSRTTLPWTQETEEAVDAWHNKNQNPFPNCARMIYPQLSMQIFSRNEVRLLYHVYALLDKLIHTNTIKLSPWTRYLPNFIGLAASSNCVRQALLAFSAVLLAWEIGSEDVRALGTAYSATAHDLLSDASSDQEALMAALVLLAWVDTAWLRWSKLNKSLENVMSGIIATTPESTLVEFIRHQHLNLHPNTDESQSQYLTDEDMKTTPITYVRIRTAMSTLQTCLRSNMDSKWLQLFTNYLSQIEAAQRARTPKEQFNYLYHLRKLLFWAPVSLLSQTGGDVRSLLLLAYWYASALHLEQVFPDIGVAYLGNYVLLPLQEVLNLLRVCQTNSTYPNIMDMVDNLIEYPQRALDEYLGRRPSWMLPRQDSLYSRSTTAGASNSTALPPTNVGGSREGHLFALNILHAEMMTPLSSQCAYSHHLSPAFHTSAFSSPPPINSNDSGNTNPTTLSGALTPPPHTHNPTSAHSPFLQVPGSSSSPLPSEYDFGTGTGRSANHRFGGLGTDYEFPYMSYTASPMIAPDMRFTSEEDLSQSLHLLSQSQAEYTPRLVSAPSSMAGAQQDDIEEEDIEEDTYMGQRQRQRQGSSMDSYTSYTLGDENTLLDTGLLASAVFQFPGSGTGINSYFSSGGCVPTAVWS